MSASLVVVDIFPDYSPILLVEDGVANDFVGVSKAIENKANKSGQIYCFPSYLTSPGRYLTGA